jgi:hypothetical protein
VGVYHSMFPLYYYQVVFHSFHHHGWGHTNEKEKEYWGPAGGLGTG